MPRGGVQFIRLSSELTLDSLVTTLCANAQFLAALQATSAQYIATIGRSHALAKAMLVASLANRRLKSPFHFRQYNGGKALPN